MSLFCEGCALGCTALMVNRCLSEARLLQEAVLCQRAYMRQLRESCYAKQHRQAALRSCHQLKCAAIQHAGTHSAICLPARRAGTAQLSGSDNQAHWAAPALRMRAGRLLGRSQLLRLQL